MTVFQTRPCGGEERFDEFRFSELAQESQGIASDVFVGVLQVVTDSVAEKTPTVLLMERNGIYQSYLPDQDHLLLKLAIRVQFRADFIVEV